VAGGRADELREVSRGLAVQARLQPIGPVSVSAGVASLPDHGASAIALLRAADRALYRAKGNGRNRVCVAEVNASGASNTPNVLLADSASLAEDLSPLPLR
jgi:PleD family two-component response regulator